MKWYWILLFCCVFDSNAMEKRSMTQSSGQQSIGSPIMWDAKIYGGVDKTYEKIVLSCLSAFDEVKFKDKILADVCSGTGYFSHILAEKVGSGGFVVGIDYSNSMISIAQIRYKDKKNLQFYQADVINYNLARFPFEGILPNPDRYSLGFDIVTLFNSLEFIKEKLVLCKNIYDCLRPDGHFICNVRSGVEPLELEVVREMINDGVIKEQWVKKYSFNEVLKQKYVTKEKYKEIIKMAGFIKSSYVEKIEILLFENKQELFNFIRPIAESRELVRQICEADTGNRVLFEQLYRIFIDRLVAKLTINEKGNLIYPIQQLFVHAWKSTKKNSSQKSKSSYETSLK